jgi:6-pyruvoyltetrahydropterin/6-carboxytetrahydropterin synthase
MVHIQRRERFNAAHRLYNPNWSDEKNFEIFGHCANQYYHGHNFSLIVDVKGKIDPETGFVIDLQVLRDIIRENVIQHVDHRNLNIDVPFMQGKMASTEVLAVEIWKILEPLIKEEGAQLHCIRIEETENNFVEYLGE